MVARDCSQIVTKSDAKLTKTEQSHKINLPVTKRVGERFCWFFPR